MRGMSCSAASGVFYASQSGSPTLDQGEGGGNPFASAFIELLERPSLSLAEIAADLAGLTEEKSRGFQLPEVPKNTISTQWKVKPVPSSVKRVALVFVYADYRCRGIPSLPGARQDLKRVALALREVGFRVQTVVDPSSENLASLLQEMSSWSEGAEAAVIYLTGHGFERNGQVYLAPNDYPFEKGFKYLPELAIHVPELKRFLNASTANLIFFGGCRSIR